MLHLPDKNYSFKRRGQEQSTTLPKSIYTSIAQPNRTFHKIISLAHKIVLYHFGFTILKTLILCAQTRVTPVYDVLAWPGPAARGAAACTELHSSNL